MTARPVAEWPGPGSPLRALDPADDSLARDDEDPLGFGFVSRLLAVSGGRAPERSR